MANTPPIRWVNWLCFVLIVLLAAGTRLWYLHTCLDNASAENPPFVVQDAWPKVVVTQEGQPPGPASTTMLDQLSHNLREGNGFVASSFLAPRDKETGKLVEEHTAQVAPGYPWLLSLAYRAVESERVLSLVRWCQCGLGALTAGLYFLFARRAFRSLVVALLAGLLCALHPFWIINTGEINDGVLTTVLLAGCLVFGTRAGETGDAFSSLLFGLALAGLTLVRAALLPFALVGLLWFLWQCRALQRGWLCAVLSVLGFANGVAAWTVRNYQTYGDILPIVDSAYVHLWIGNNPQANGGPLDPQLIEGAIEPERQEELRAVPNQYRRYQMLARDVADFVAAHPAATMRNRIAASLYFFLGQAWFTNPPAPGLSNASPATVPPLLLDNYTLIVNGLLMAMLLLGLLGWRWTHSARYRSGLAALATMWVPLPYILSHADMLWGPRLPLDGVILCYVAFAVVFVLPVLRRTITRGGAGA